MIELQGVIHKTKSTCPYCGVGCGVIIESRGDQITGVAGDPDHPANFGKLCSKGSTLHLTTQPVRWTARAKSPMHRTEKQSELKRTTWDATLDHVADQFAECIKTHGPDSVAFYVSGQLLTEDYYVFNKLAKGLIGTNNVDTNSRLCMSSAVTGYKQTLGADAPPCSYEDIELADCVLIAGSNMAYAHPVLYRRLEAARAIKPKRVIVIDPRHTDTAAEADLHLQIMPGTDVALFNAMLNVMLWEGLVNHAYIAAHTEGFDALKDMVREYTPAMAADICGVRKEDIITAAKWFGQSPASLSLYCQGLNQSASGTAKNAALINLHLATAQIGKPGAGPFSLTGQPNAMGGREVGGLANLLSAHRDMANPAHRAEVAQLWNVADVPATPGKTAVEMFDALHSGDIKMIWIACTNPAQSLPTQTQVHEALAKAELVVLQDCYSTTETATYADVILPATTWGEKEGTVTNSERRISRVRPAVVAPFEARNDWEIVVDFARRLEERLGVNTLSKTTLFPYDTAEAVWNEHRESTRGRDLDITGLSYDILENVGPQQWPFVNNKEHSRGIERLYADGVFPTASGKAKFVANNFKPVAEATDARYALHFTTGRLRDQWHCMSRTGTLAQLYSHAPEAALQMDSVDLARRNLKVGDVAKISSRRGSVYARVAESESLRPGLTYMPMHWGKRFLGGAKSYGVNTLTTPVFDPFSKQPELKHCAVKVEKAELPFRVTVFGFPADGDCVRAMNAANALQHHFDYFSCALIGREEEGVMIRAANATAVDAVVLNALDEMFSLDDGRSIRYDDARKDKGSPVGRRVLLRGEGSTVKLAAVRLSGELTDVAAEPWLSDWLTRGELVEPIRRLLLMPTSQPPAGYRSAGRVVCNCWNVTEPQITNCLSGMQGPPEALLSALQSELKCGTNCGSCVPELKQIVRQVKMSTVASMEE